MRSSICGLFAFVAVGASAQGTDDAAGSGGRAYYLVPTLNTSLQYTNNVNLSPTDKRSDLILGISPGIQIGGQSGRVRGFLNYALMASIHARDSAESNFTNYLNARGNAEVVPAWLFIEAGASISQQYIDPFGTQSPDVSLNNPNRTEVSTIDVAPYVQGQIAGQVNYLGRAFYTYTNSGTSQASDSTAYGALLSFDSSTRWARLSWGLDFSYREVDFKEGRNNFDQLNVASLTYAVTPELKLSLRGNVETSNLVTFDNDTTTGWGGGLRWNPSPRTNLFLEYDKRVFGNSHVYSFDYRTPRTVWAISSTRSLSTGQRNTGRGSAGSPFDLLFAQFATVEPDPLKREQLVNDFLKANGIDPKSSLNNGFLPDQVQVQEQNQASAAWLGKRSSFLLNVYQTQTQNLGPGSNPGNDFALGNEITWLGFGVTWSHRLTELSTFSLNGNQQRTKQGASNQETTLRTATALWTHRLAERVALAVSGSYTVQTGNSTYNEAAVLASVSMQF